MVHTYDTNRYYTPWFLNEYMKKGRGLTQSYDKFPDTYRKIQSSTLQHVMTFSRRDISDRTTDQTTRSVTYAT